MPAITCPQRPLARSIWYLAHVHHLPQGKTVGSRAGGADALACSVNWEPVPPSAGAPQPAPGLKRRLEQNRWPHECHSTQNEARLVGSGLSAGRGVRPQHKPATLFRRERPQTLAQAEDLRGVAFSSHPQRKPQLPPPLSPCDFLLSPDLVPTALPAPGAGAPCRHLLRRI